MKLAHVMVLLCTASANAQEAATWRLGPGSLIYEEYLADPRRPQMAIGPLFAFDSDLADLYESGNNRIDIRLGERIPVLQYTETDGQSWQLVIEGAFFGQFDRSESLENIGWDGWYGGSVSRRFSEDWAAKLHYRHLSSHLGDEFIERTGRARIGYTREDITLGVAWQYLAGADLYMESGVNIHDGAARQESLYFQLGTQYRQLRPTILNIFGWHIGVDAQLFQEEDYTPELTIQGALLIPAANDNQFMRLAIEAHAGRVSIGELSDLREKSIALFFGWEF